MSGDQTNLLTSMIDICSGVGVTCDEDNKNDSGYNKDGRYKTTGIELNIGDIITMDIENDDWCTDYDHDENAMTI